MKKKIVLLFSGGLDCTLLLKLAKQLEYDVYCVLFDYGQVHIAELGCAMKICKESQVPYTTVQLNLPIKSNLTSVPQTYRDVHEKHVPSRNMIFVSIASGIAETLDFDTIWLGANYPDRENLFPDCYQEWVYQINKVLAINGSKKITLEAPLLGMSKELIQDLSIQFNINKSQIFSGYGN